MTDAQRIEDLERWRDGNGKPGAAAMIANHELRLLKIEDRTESQEQQLREIDIHHAREKSIMQDVIREALKERSHTIEGIIRMMGPYIAALSAIAVAFISRGG